MNPVELLGLVNYQAEVAVLSAMRFNAPTTVQLADLLVPEDFHDTRHALLFEAVRQVLRGIEPLTDESILMAVQQVQRDRKQPIYLADDYLAGFDAGDFARAIPYAQSLKRLAWLRQAGDFAHWLVDELQTRPEPDELFAASQERWQLLRPKTAESRFVYGWDTVASHEQVIRQRIQDFQQGTQRRYDWPWASWNAKGRVRPLRPGMLGIIAAPDGQGKTTYLEMIAEHWVSRGIQTVYVHLEDELEYKKDRRLARHAMVDLDKIEDGDLTEYDQHQIREANRRIGGWADGLHYYDAAGESMPVILQELEARIAEGVCEAIVFDYLDKVQPSSGQVKVYGTNTWERQANDIEQLKTFAERNKIPVLTATQGNKQMQTQGTVQTRQAIQGSGQKSQRSQLVVILTRDLVGKDGLRDGNGKLLAEAGEYSPFINVRIDKQNRGRTGNFTQFLVGRFFRVGDIEKRQI